MNLESFLIHSPLNGDFVQLKQRKRSSIKCNCNWVIKFQYIDKRKKDKIKVIKIYPHHTNTCQPGKDQLVRVRTAANNYATFSSTILKDLIKLIDLNYFITSRTIRELLQRAFPKRKSSDDGVDARMKAKRFIKQIKSKGKSIKTFQYNEDTALSLIRGLDDVNSDFIDKAIQCSKEIFEDYLHNPNNKIIFLAIPDKLGTIDPMFVYNFCMDNQKKIIGFVWMTSVMRSNLYRLGSFINVDLMK